MRPREGAAAVAASDAEVSATRSHQRPAKTGRLKHPNGGRLLGCSLGLCLVLLAGRACAQGGPNEAASQTGRPQSETTPQAGATAAPSEASLEPTGSSNLAALQQQHKLRPINFTLVDEHFESTVNESELLRHWKNMDGQFQEGIRSILKLVFPQIVAVSQDAKVSGDCSGGILKWILSLRNLRSWAIKMLDATGKPTAGIFEGSLTMFGNHRQCLGIRAPDEDEIEITDQFEEYFRGQFCVLHLRPWLSAKKPFYHLNSSVEPLLRKSYKYYEKTLYDELAEIAVAFNFIDIRMDLCVPSTCSTADIQRVADLLSKKLEMRAKVMRCDIESRDSSATFVQNLDRPTVVWLAGPVCLLLATLVSTLLVLVRGSGPSDRQAGRRLTLDRMLFCLSVQGALGGLFAGSKPARPTISFNQPKRMGVMPPQTDADAQFERPLPLYGLRNVIIVWYIIVQLTVELKYQYLRESLVLRNMMLAYWPLQIVINTSMIFESLILITAFTFGYSSLETSAKGLLAYIVRKYARLVPSIATIVAATIVLPSIGISSPVWRNFVESQSAVCKSTGYLNLFFLQNFISFDKICLPHTWLFCVELQLIALSIPLVLLLQRTFKRTERTAILSRSEQDLAKAKGPRNGLPEVSLARRLLTSRAGLCGAALVSAGAVGNFVVVYTNQLPPAWFHTFPDAEQKNYYFSLYLVKASTHLTTFLVGLFAGHLTRAGIQLRHSTGSSDNNNNTNNGSSRTRDETSQRRRRKLRRAALQLAAAACLALVIFLPFSWSTQQLPSPFVAALYDSGSRLAWSIALAGLMRQLCRPNSAGAYSRVSRLFSRPASVALGRLSFLAYLTAPLVHTFVLAVQEQSLFPSLYLIFHVMLGNIVITYLLAFVLSLMIERPTRQVVGQLSHVIAARSRGCATIPEANATTNTSATSLAG